MRDVESMLLSVEIPDPETCCLADADARTPEDFQYHSWPNEGFLLCYMNNMRHLFLVDYAGNEVGATFDHAFGRNVCFYTDAVQV